VAVLQLYQPNRVIGFCGKRKASCPYVKSPGLIDDYVHSIVYEWADGLYHHGSSYRLARGSEKILPLPFIATGRK